MVVECVLVDAAQFRRFTYRQPFMVGFNGRPLRSFPSVWVDIYFNAEYNERIPFLLERCLVVFAFHNIEEVEKAEDAPAVDVG